VDKRTLQDALHRQFLGRSIVLGKVSDEVDQCALTRSLIKEVLHLLSDDAIRKAKDYSLTDHPSLKGMPKELIPEFFNLRRRIMLSALLTVALRAEIFAYSLSTSAFCEAQVDNEFLGYLLRFLKRFTLVLRTGSFRLHLNDRASL